MADIFREVDEEVRREKLKQLWDRYAPLIVAVAFLIVAGIGGWRAYQWWEAKQAAEAGATFEAAVSLVSEGKHAEAEAAFARIGKEGSSGYRVLARFRQAAEVARTDRDAAVKAYDALASDSAVSAVLQDLARVRAAMLLIDTASLEEIRNRIEPVTASGRAFRHTARELMAFAAWRVGDAAATKRWYEMIVTDPETPQGTRTRTEMLMALATPEAKS